MSSRFVPVLLMIAGSLSAAPCSAQVQADAALSSGGPPAPILPQTIARDDQGRTVVRMVLVTPSLNVDGALDEAVYTAVEPMSDFTQMEPNGGELASERTEVWLFHDQRNVYVVMRAWESDPSRTIANEMRRDSSNIRQGDSVGFAFDTYHDRRNAMQFEVNSLGGRTDGQSTNERQYNGDWNPVWEVAVGAFEGGWTMEAAIPFKSLRYAPGRSQTWGFQARRTNKWKNEISFLTRIPPAYGIGRGSFAASLFATMVGLEAPAASRNLELKPYLIGNLTTDRTRTPGVRNDPGGDVGLDAKYGVTQNLTADFTYNTDFAQVEADEQQVNLTRFTLFFPEKRDFFLENLGTFTFGGVIPGQNGGNSADSADAPILFYSRRIGLSQGVDVPIRGGGRLTGRIGRFTLGLLDIQTAAPATNFSVMRIKRDILRRSSIGAIFTGRSASPARPGSNTVIGVDGTFAFFENLAINTFLAKTASDGLVSDDTSYRAQLDYAGDRYGLQLERLVVGANFNPEVGYLRRNDMYRSYGLFRYSPRPSRQRRVRKYSTVSTVTHIDDGAGRLNSRLLDEELAIEFQNSDRLAFGINDDYELLKRPFAITPRVDVPVGAYRFLTYRMGFNLGQQRPVSGNLLLEQGSFYDGSRTTVTYNRARVNVTSRLSAEPNLSVTWVDLPAAAFTTTLFGSRVTYTIRPLMFVSALVQYYTGTSTVSGNLRFRWEYRPGSELFLVYNEERDTLAPSFPGLRNRSLILKINRLFRP